MKESRKKKDEQLGMPLGTASAKLRKSILFSLLRESHKNVCYQCGRIIDEEDELSIEHKIPWLDSDNPKELFFNLENIAFSHLSCNIGAARQNREGKRESQRKLVVEGRTKRTNLTIETVRNIKTDLATMSRKDICNKYGITKSTLANIAREETFQYID